MIMNGVKRKEHYITPDLSTSFQDWAVGKSAINDSLDPWDRAQRLLVEIQKRSLAEHVLLLSWDTRRETCQTLAMAPTGDKPVFSDDVRLSLIRRAYVLRHALFWKDLRDDEPLIEALRKEKCHTITVYPLTIQNSLIDALVIVNYSTWRDSVQVTEYVSFISSVLALAIQNLRLYLELEKKDLELQYFLSQRLSSSWRWRRALTFISSITRFSVISKFLSSPPRVCSPSTWIPPHGNPWIPRVKCCSSCEREGTKSALCFPTARP